MSATTWEKLPPLPGRANPCLCCPPIGERLHMDRVIAVGFGSATVERDGEVLYSEPMGESGMYWDVAEAEKLALADPDHDWRIVLYGPLHGEVYQRHEPGAWMLVEKNEGFA